MGKAEDETRRPGLFSRLAEPLAERTRERIEHVEDRVRRSIQSEIDAVSRSVRARAVQVRPSAIAFAVALLLTVFGLALLVTAGVVALALVLPLWLSALLAGVLLVLVAAGCAAWGRSKLPQPVRVAPAGPGPAPDAEELVHPWTD
ncbi:phage holin family protein [Cellulomonas sp. C5510]|uniref:phage holin family protein n=1 Tax=Cellulomonas sp. C5510 TaxID=2871170 RepID=UPI001C97092B|nr:phage holin family protein [Cellulomonas sp. C5510]QZN85219.1 phage holin family protein [Cellulomonas sp. C5510]